jgi:hypothetical protein
MSILNMKFAWAIDEYLAFAGGMIDGLFLAGFTIDKKRYQ